MTLNNILTKQKTRQYSIKRKLCEIRVTWRKKNLQFVIQITPFQVFKGAL